MRYKTIEEGLAGHQRILVHTVGVSMEPLLHDHKSTVVLEKLKGPLKRGDVVLYRRPTGECILHRVTAARNGVYRIRGDNCLWSELVPQEWVIGSMVGYYPDEGDCFTSCTDREYRGYLYMLPWRYGYLLLHSILGRVVRKTKRCLGV